MDEQKKGTRRRGEVLEEAILLAAWEELAETDYTHLTMESIAARAGTNKAVLYRRWANKSALVIAALHKHMPRITADVPNTGNLRDDVFAFLNGLAQPIMSIGAQTIRGLMMDPMVRNTIATAMPQIARSRSEGKDKLTLGMAAILENAELRGEICLEKLSRRIATLPLDLLQFEVITRQGLSDTAITEIVDDIFLPLIQISCNKDKK